VSARRVVLLAATLALGACFSEHTPAAPTTTVSFSANVEPFLNSTCAFSGCHGTTNTRPNNKPMVLATGQAYDNIVNVSAGELATMMRIRPSKPDSSYLIHKLQGTHLTVGGSGARMPLNQAALPQSQIDMMRTWVSEGAKRN
jgi:hypothetical protein